MSEGRALVYPQAIGFGARPLAVPGRGHVLCASALYAFRLSDRASVAPAQWYQTVSEHAGANAVPDSMVPLPGAEVLILGPLSPVVDERRDAYLRCGAIERRIVLYADAERPDEPILPGPEAAAWHEHDNPLGRGGPDDDRYPLITAAGDSRSSLWLGVTPFDHPMRLRRAGTPGPESGTGWPANAQPTVLHDAHPAFWAEALYAGEPLALEGFGATDVATQLPPYRVTITSGHNVGRWAVEPTRIHCVALIPSADMGAVIHRAAIPLGNDILGESVGALIAALEDADSPMQDEEHWSDIAADRWEDPVRSLDDRPLLPKALAATVTLPFDLPDDGAMEARRAATEAWMREEAGLPDESPFADTTLEEAGLADKMQSAVGDEGPPNQDAVAAVAQEALAAGRRRHEEAGFEPPEVDAQAPREPEVRGQRLDAEITRRLLTPYGGASETAMAERVRSADIDGLDAGETLGKITDARLLNPNPPLSWPALDEAEGSRFGDRIVTHLEEREFGRHIDISSATVAGGLGDADRKKIADRQFDRVLAAEATWRDVDFTNCEFIAASFAGGRFEQCTFDHCAFEAVNLSRATLVGCTFKDCTLRDLRLTDPTWMDCRFDRCDFERFSATDAAVRDLAFVDGTWREVEWVEGLLVGVALQGTAMQQVTYASTHAPNSRFEQLSMFKVWAMTKGFPGSVFQEVEAKTCGFLASCHFDEAQFVDSRFVETGFANAVFTNARLAAGCRFDACDFSGAMFENTMLGGVRFLHCSMATSLWAGGIDATEAWFLGALLRGVDFKDTKLTRAVFMDADLDGTTFQADRTIGADFRGTVRA